MSSPSSPEPSTGGAGHPQTGAAPVPPDASRSAFQSAFRHRPFTLFWLARLAAGMAMQMQVVAVGWQIYALTGSAWHLGLVGLFQFLPTLVMALYAGHVVDNNDRRHILLAALVMQMGAVGALCAVTVAGLTSPLFIYATVLVLGTVKAFEGPANQALLSALVPARDLPNAVAWNSSGMQVSVVTGPALGGLLYIAGPSVVYGTSTAFLALAALFILLVRPRPVELPRRAMSLESMLAGLTFIRSRPAIFGAISLDMVAVLLGGATALLPLYARDILHVGPVGLGLLRSAPAVGALTMAVLLARYGVQRNAGAWMLAAVAGFGAATVLFGLSTVPALSFLALLGLGAADQISVFVRQTLVQLSTPDDMRGRVGAVTSLFIGASNQLGEFESGAAAALLGGVTAVVAGGFGAMGVAALWAWRFPELRRVDRLSAIG
ncbi:MFS transporter [Azospirillum sp. SYSU D00513]|uniref:MFS transporter n=1 Tax=Azospirillum sp. SYSU D00513 TaxID=2812561 RepID=UPI001A960A94|nr:MFS transporter [Azospirillum sp. SYSU D00513]